MASIYTINVVLTVPSNSALAAMEKVYAITKRLKPLHIKRIACKKGRVVLLEWKPRQIDALRAKSEIHEESIELLAAELLLAGMPLSEVMRAVEGEHG